MDKDTLIKDSIDYLENRIRSVDNKASILLGIEIAIITAFIWVITKFLGVDLTNLPKSITFVISALATFSIVIQIFLLQAIRPTKYFLSVKTEVKHRAKGKGVMWPRNIDREQYSDFVEKLKKMSSEDIESEYLSTLYTSQLLVNAKYKYYRKAVLLIKYQVIIYIFSLIIYALCS